MKLTEGNACMPAQPDRPHSHLCVAPCRERDEARALASFGFEGRAPPPASATSPGLTFNPTAAASPVAGEAKPAAARALSGSPALAFSDNGNGSGDEAASAGRADTAHAEA